MNAKQKQINDEREKNQFKKTIYINFSDLKPMRSILKEPTDLEKQILQQNNLNQDIPIIIDYGSLFTKAGWANSQDPDLIFRTFVNKTKGYKQNFQLAVISTMSKEIDVFKGTYRSPYDRDVIQHFGLLENINDYIFTELGVEGDRVNHPLMLTETVANPEYNRMNLYEQYFECYQVPSVFYGIDSLFSYYYYLQNFEEYKQKSCLLISMSNSCCHIIPILKGQIMYEYIKRVNVGGQNSFEIFSKSISLKSPHLKQYMTYNNLHSLFQNHTEVAYDYKDQLNYFKYQKSAFSNEFYNNEIKYKNNLLIDEYKDFLIEPTELIFPNTKQILDEQDVERKRQLRLKAADRLREAVNKKKQEKEEKHQKELEDLTRIENQYNEDPQIGQIEIDSLLGPKNKGIEEIRQRLKKVKINMGLISKDDQDKEKYHLINIDDSELTADQKKLKRQQIMLKAAADARAEKKKHDQEKKEEYKKWKEENPDKYLETLYEKRNKLFKKIEARKKQKQELTQRNSKLNMKRMQTLAQLGQDEQGNTNSKKIKDDNFGMDDEDWNLYLGISKHNESDDENHDIKLNEVEIELRELDPEFEEKIKQGSKNPYHLNMNENFIELDVDKIRGPETFFQPSICGIDSAGIIETITYVLNYFNKKDQQELLQSILLTGGSSQTKNLIQRLEKDIKSNFESGTKLNIRQVQDPILDSWKGMKLFQNQYPELVKQYSVTQQDYLEKGGQNDIFISNPFSNVIIPRNNNNENGENNMEQEEEQQQQQIQKLNQNNSNLMEEEQ